MSNQYVNVVKSSSAVLVMIGGVEPIITSLNLMTIDLMHLNVVKSYGRMNPDLTTYMHLGIRDNPNFFSGYTIISGYTIL